MDNVGRPEVWLMGASEPVGRVMPPAAAGPSSFIRADCMELFEEHQRIGKHYDLNEEITNLIRDLHSKGTFADRMARRSLEAIQADTAFTYPEET